MIADRLCVAYVLSCSGKNVFEELITKATGKASPNDRVIRTDPPWSQGCPPPHLLYGAILGTGLERPELT